MSRWETPRPWNPARERRVALGVVTAAIAVPLVASTALASKPAKKPDLVVKTGSFTVTGGKLSATFKVKNTGSGRAASSSAAVSTVDQGKAVLLGKGSVASLAAGKSATVTVKATLSAAFLSGKHELSTCVDRTSRITEKSEANNCLDLGTFDHGTITLATGATPTASPVDVPKPVPATPGGSPAGSPAAPTSTPAPVAAIPTSTPAATPKPTPTPVPTPTGPQPRPTSTVPTAPLSNVPQDESSTIGDGAGKYWIFVPQSYDSSGTKPIRLLVWMHGCYGQSEGEIYNASVGGAGQNYITIAPGGQEYGVDPGNGCWDLNVDPARVWSMVADVETHFNIDRRRIVLGGYSSGGDMTYRMAFDDAYDVAGVLVENSAPFQDTGLTSAAIGSAFWKFNVAHLAHTGDGTYLIGDVRTQLDQLKQAGFPVTPIELPGGHEDKNTDKDMRAQLLPFMKKDWLAPAGP